MVYLQNIKIEFIIDWGGFNILQVVFVDIYNFVLVGVVFSFFLLLCFNVDVNL